jgi:hypothetical protein
MRQDDGEMTRREKHMTMLDLLEDHLTGNSAFTRQELLDGIRYARGRGEAPAWWAETVYELRAQRREDNEEAV